MIDNSILIKFKGDKLRSVQYVKTHSTLSLRESVEYVESLWKSHDLKTGTVTWFECDEVNFPAAQEDNIYGYSENILLTNGRHIGIGSYCHGFNGATKHWHTSVQETVFIPTHWAYINLPA